MEQDLEQLRCHCDRAATCPVHKVGARCLQLLLQPGLICSACRHWHCLLRLDQCRGSQLHVLHVHVSTCLAAGMQQSRQHNQSCCALCSTLLARGNTLCCQGHPVSSWKADTQHMHAAHSMCGDTCSMQRSTIRMHCFDKDHSPGPNKGCRDDGAALPMLGHSRVSSSATAPRSAFNTVGSSGSTSASA